MTASRSMQYLKYYETPRAGLEPATARLTAVCSTIELSRIIQESTKEKLSLPFSLHLQNYISMIQFLTSFQILLLCSAGHLQILQSEESQLSMQACSPGSFRPDLLPKL